jgi:hypothetical protein
VATTHTYCNNFCVVAMRSMAIGRFSSSGLVHHPKLLMRSPLATTMQRISPSHNEIPSRSIAGVSMKLCVKTESSNAISLVSLMSTRICIVLRELSWMLVTAWMEIVGSLTATSSDAVSSFSRTSMTKRCLHSALCPNENLSS